MNAPPSEEMAEIADIIAKQMGGTRRLGLMIGAKDFLYGFDHTDNCVFLQFKWKARAKQNLNTIRILYQRSPDCYIMEFYAVRGINSTRKARFESVYVEQLREIFERETGLYLNL